MQLEVMDHEGEALSPSAAVILILQKLREKDKNTGLGLIRVDSPQKDRGRGAGDMLRDLLRGDDQVILLETGVLIALVKVPPENIPLIAQRLIPLFRAKGYERGSLAMWVPEWETEAIFEWIQKRPNQHPQSGWNLHPETWPFKPEVLSPGPSVDPLTGVLKSDRVPRALRRMMAVYRRIGETASLIRLDIDQLDSYNRSYGEETGDLVLKTVADLLMDNCRENDLIGRMQEDEFVIAIHGNHEDVMKAVRRMSAKVKNHTLNHEEKQIRFSISCGLSSMPEDGRNPMLLLERAGWAMQEAKKRGRGTSMAFHPDMIPSSLPAEEPGPDSF